MDRLRHGNAFALFSVERGEHGLSEAIQKEFYSNEDYRCWLVEGIATFQALKLHGCEAKMVVFNGDNHELSRSGQPRNRIKRMEEILAWYDAHLKA